MGALNLSCMAKSNRMTKTDYICQLLNIVEAKAHKCTVKQLKQLIAKNA
jgi:hypothetical protein